MLFSRIRHHALGLCATLLLSTLSTHAIANPPSSILVSAGAFMPFKGDSDLDAGLYGDGNYVRTHFNFGSSLKVLDGLDPVLNAFVGTGYNKAAQVQAGFGTQGLVARIRSDVNLSTVTDAITFKKRTPYNRHVGGRFAMSFAAEFYKDEDDLNNVSLGIGMLY